MKQGPTLAFDREGRQQDHRLDEGQTTSTYDEDGLRTTVSSRPPSIRRQPGLEYGICMDAGVRFDVLTRYDAEERPVEVVFRDTEQKALHRIVLAYDHIGRIARETVLMGDVLGRVCRTTSETPSPIDQPSAEELQELQTAFKAMMPDGVFLTREYVYDDRGRVAQLLQSMGRLSEDRHSYTYDDQGNVLEEHLQSSHREGETDSEGNLITKNESSEESWTRYEYRYDEHGNWVEKSPFHRATPDRDFHRSSIERRTIVYFD
jgi:YD repeat-containing protein